MGEIGRGMGGRGSVAELGGLRPGGEEVAEEGKEPLEGLRQGLAASDSGEQGVEVGEGMGQEASGGVSGLKGGEVAAGAPGDFGKERQGFGAEGEEIGAARGVGADDQRGMVEAVEGVSQVQVGETGDVGADEDDAAVALGEGVGEGVLETLGEGGAALGDEAADAGGGEEVGGVAVVEDHDIGTGDRGDAGEQRGQERASGVEGGGLGPSPAECVALWGAGEDEDGGILPGRGRHAIRSRCNRRGATDKEQNVSRAGHRCWRSIRSRPAMG